MHCSLTRLELSSGKPPRYMNYILGGDGGDRGAGVRGNRGREGYGRRERKWREAGVLRGREAGGQYKTVNFFTY